MTVSIPQGPINTIRQIERAIESNVSIPQGPINTCYFLLQDL